MSHTQNIFYPYILFSKYLLNIFFKVYNITIFSQYITLLTEETSKSIITAHLGIQSLAIASVKQLMMLGYANTKD